MNARALLLKLLPFSLALLTACAPSVYDTPYPVTEVRLPRDDAAHKAPIEWWYYTGHLTSETGEDYGFELTFFKAYTPPYVKLGFYPAFWAIDKGYVAHFAVTDKARRRFTKGERVDYWGYPGGASSEALEVYTANWRAERAPDGVSHRIYAAEGGYKLDLILTPTKPAARHGNPPGIQSMGPGGVSYYLSYTRMKATGTLKRNCGPLGLGCETLKVTGQAWSDHQWGDFNLGGYAGWDWFSMQFEDNTELMLYLIRAPSGAYLEVAGSFITRDGKTLRLEEQDIEVAATGETWTSPQTGAVYPVAWRVRVPKHGVDVRVVPVFPEQEMDTRASTGVVYWEGAVEVAGSKAGVGYVELTNYDRYPYGETDETTALEPPQGPFGQ